MTTPISKSRLIRIFLYSVISPCCPLLAISADGTEHETSPGTFTGGQLCTRVVTIRMPDRQCNFHRDMRKLVTFMNLILNVLCTMTTCEISFFAFLTQNRVVNSPLWPAKFSLIVGRNHLDKCCGLYGVTETRAGWRC